MIELLKILGYERDYQNDLQYFDQTDPQVMSKRRKAAEELKNFTDELKRAKENDFAGFKEFLSTRQTKKTTDQFQQRFDNERISPRRQPAESGSTESRSSLASVSKIGEGNDKTLQVIRQIKVKKKHIAKCSKIFVRFFF